MNHYKLIEKEFGNQLQDLPIFYKILKSSLIENDAVENSNPSIFTKSSRHQTNQYEAKRFYKNITIFNI